MKRIFTLLIALTSLVAAAQTEAHGYDPEAGKILKELAKKYKSYTTMQASITYKMINKDADIDQSQDIKIKLEGNKFRMDMEGLGLILCNGTDIWNLNLEDEEGSINTYEPSEEDEITPTNVFTMYEKGFFYIVGEEFKIDNKNYLSIDLAPEDKTKDYFKIRMFVDPNEKYVKRMRVFAKDGTHFIYDVDSFQNNNKFDANTFEFSASEFPNIEIEDLR